jgi:hypothetical protein
MLSDAKIRDLRVRAHARARRQSDAALLAAAAKTERVQHQARSEDAREAFTILTEAYREELERRQRR